MNTVTVTTRPAKFRTTRSARTGTRSVVPVGERERLIAEARATNPILSDAAAEEINYNSGKGVKVTFNLDLPEIMGM